MAPPYDLRSDTVSQPTPAMREAMARAPVGDDCYGDDPSVAALERRVAALLGKDDAVFLPTGTMCNQLAVRLHAKPGETIATHETAHVRIHEDASAAALSGVQLMPLGGRRGYTIDQLDQLVREESCGWPRVAAAWLENTLGDAGGVPWPLHQATADADGMHAIAQWAHRRGRTVHLDGARLWNAHVATGTPLADLAEIADTVTVAMSKGLGAPGGSLLVGDDAWVSRARAAKHGLGGGMRQVGILAAAGSHGLDHHLDGLHEDHRRARRLADAVSDLRLWTVQPPTTNMVICEVDEAVGAAEVVCAPLRAAGVLCHPNRYREVRWVLHLGIDDAAVEDIAARVRAALGSLLP